MLAIVLVLTFAAPALALVARAGETVAVTRPVRDDLYAAGSTVLVSAAVDGDIVAAGRSVSLEGPVTGGVLVAGGTLRLGSITVARTVRAVAGTVAVGSRVGADVVAAGGTVTIESGARVARDLAAWGGDIQVLGSVGRNLWAGGGTVTIAGPVGGDARVEADRIVLLPTARIAGRLLYRSDIPPDVRPGARVAGGIERLPGERVRPQPLAVPPAIAPLGRLLEGLWLLIVGLVAFAVAPRAAARTSEEVGARFGWSLLLGFGLLVGVPVAGFLLLFTVVGIPLSVLALLLYFVTLYLGQVFVAGWVGSAVLRRARRDGTPPSAYWSVALGVLVLVVFFAIPYAGWIARAVIMLVGFGAIWLSTFQAVTAAGSSTV
jgi:hypothetical protein